MGRFSEAVFGRDQLPPSSLLCGGAYVPWKREVLRSLLPGGTRLAGTWVRYSYAESGRGQTLVLFNVYGASITLEVLRLLEDGRAEEVVFVGSVYVPDLPVGTLVVPRAAVDQAGIASLDAPGVTTISADPTAVSRLRKALHEAGLLYVEREVVSVPSVLHAIPRVNEVLAKRRGSGVEMEVSTLYHFAPKLGLRAYALLYVSDNEERDIISRAEDVRKARRWGMREAVRVAQKVLRA